MGSLTEYLAYLEEDPKFLNETKKTFSHITPSDKMKKTRNELKLYKKDVL